MFEAYTEVIVQALKDRMKACASKHSDSIKYCDTRKSGGTFSFNTYETMRGLIKKIEQYKLGDC